MAIRRLRLGLIGCGQNMLKSHLPRIQADGAVELAAVADPVSEPAERLMADWGSDVPYYADWRRLLAECDLDGVIISTPHDVHYAQARAALAGGVHVLVEKPLTISVRHSKALLELADRNGTMLAVAYQRHHMAPYRYARELIAGGKIGHVGGVVAYVTQSPVARIEWRIDPAAAGGGMFADTGSHLVAAMLWVTGLEPRWVNAVVDRRDEPVDVNTVLQVGFAGDAVGTLAAFGAAGRHDERLAISGSDGSIVLHMHEWKFRSLLVNDEPVVIPKRVGDGTPDRTFFGWIRSGGKGYWPPLAAHRAVQLTAAAYRSADRGRPSRIRP